MTPVTCTATVAIELSVDLELRFGSDNAPEGVASAWLKIPGQQPLLLDKTAIAALLTDDVLEDAAEQCDPEQERRDAYADEHDDDEVDHAAE